MWPCVHPAAGWPLLVFYGSLLKGARQVPYPSDLPEHVVKPCLCDNRNDLGWILLYVCIVLVGAIVTRDSVDPDMPQTCAAGSGDERKGEQPFYVKDSAERAAPQHVRCLLSSRGALTAVVQAVAAQRPHLPKVRGNGGPPPGARMKGRTHAGVFYRYSLLALQLDWQWSRRRKSGRSFNAGAAIPLVGPPSWFQRRRL
ncbi:hypothetical protein NDU88_000725 [Pleurodeles waltl]|uniref:Uncharacterized protein n=1 Tax=Pleurodeles waltl TaxID=8319 RepID=A0AAV7U621_PLEWA|nr:hypothetical protein NDU88_000725 [Pleurodeles waltl]